MEIVFSDDDLRRCLPPAGRYRVAIAAVATSSPDRQPSEVRLTWATVDPPGTPPIYDCFLLRGALSRALPGMRRLLGLLARAGIDVHPGQPIDLRALVGLECLIDVARDLDESGFPFSRIVRYQPVACPNRAGDPRATHGGSRNDRPNGSHGPRDAADRAAGLQRRGPNASQRQPVVHDPGTDDR